MKNLSLRTRVFLFFCLAGLGSLAITLIALWIGFRQLDQPDALSSFTTSAIIAAFGILALTAAIWLLFDDNVSKPIEAIAASLRVRAHVEMTTPIDVTSAKYLGDLAPAASDMGAVLDKVTKSRTEEDNRHLTELKIQRDQLVQILSDIPVATILASAEHRVVLYDGQAAALMERVGAARLKTSVFDYLDQTAILSALSQMDGQEKVRRKISVTAHCGEVYTGHIRSFGDGAGYTLMLETLEPEQARPLTYDFDLLSPASAADWYDTPLRELVYVVFDTETTGLNSVTDEVVQLGAVRVVNGKIVAGEAFETLVNPGIPIPKRSTDVHGIRNAMVADAPLFEDVCFRFHSFVKGAILVAHNASFDMAFLHKQSAERGTQFDNPVLDTVLISAAIFGGSAVHTLDAICERLGVQIPPDQRHTAIGDAVATSKALIAMLGVLEGRGIKSFGELVRETEKHHRILRT